MMRRLKLIWLCGLVLVLSSACASATRGGVDRGDPNVLTRDEIQTVNASNLYDVIQRLRPRWLRSHGTRSFGMSGTPVVVYQNNTMLGEPNVLRQLAPGIAATIQYMDGPKASATLPGLGSRIVEGAIVIYTSQNGPQS